VPHKFEIKKVENSKLDRTYVAVAELFTLLKLVVVSLKATFVLKQRKVKNDFGNFDQILVRFVILLLFDLILYLCHFNKHLSSSSLVNK